MTKMGQKLSREEKIQNALLKRKLRYAKMLKKRPKLKRLSKRRAKMPSIKKLELKLKKVMYPAIKKRDGPKCISCGTTIKEARNWQAGHFLKAELCNLIVRYDPRNINSQCGACNVWKRGNTIEYRKAMIKKYGVGVVQELEDKYRQPLLANFNPREFLTNLINQYGG